MIDISKILQYAPKGLELYHRGYGYVYLYDVKNDEIRLSDCPDNTKIYGGWCCSVDAYGKEHKNGECLLFPSKEYTSWKSWQQILFPKSIGSIVTDSMDGLFIITNEGLKDSRGKLVSIQVKESDKYASPEDTKTFFNFLNINGFKWNDEKKEIERCLSVKDIIELDESIINSELGINRSVYDLTGIRDCGVQIGNDERFNRGDVIVSDNDCSMFVYINNECVIDCNGVKHKVVSSIYRPATPIERTAFEKQLNENGFIWDFNEQNVVEVNPCKFKVGDWIVRNSNGEVLKITGYTKNVYYPPYSPTFDLSNGKWITRGKLESDFHIWSISDVKCGDIIIETTEHTTSYYLVKEFSGGVITSYCSYNKCPDIGVFWGFEECFTPKKEYRPCEDGDASNFYALMSKNNYSWDTEEMKALRDEQIKNQQLRYEVSDIDIKPLDYVIVRENDTEKWKLAIFSYYDKKYKDYVCNNGLKYKQCVPYNDETSYLLGTMYFNI